MPKIRLNESEMIGLIHKAIDNVKNESVQPVRFKLSEIRQVIKNSLLEFNRRNIPSSTRVEKQYEVERDVVDPATEDYSPLVFTVVGNVEFGDSGIGSYEFQGSPGYDEQVGYNVTDYGLLENSYNPNDKEAIFAWINKHSDEVETDLVNLVKQ